MPKGKDWSEEELKTLRYIWKCGYTVKEKMHLLPGRSLTAIKCAAYVHGLPKKKRGFISWVRPAVLAILKDAPGLTANEICATVQCSDRHITDILKRLNATPGKKVFIASWCRSGTRWVQRWELGSREDAPKPGKQSPDERRKIDRIQHRRKTSGFNPFAVAAGLVAAPNFPTGRVFTQSMSIVEEEVCV